MTCSTTANLWFGLVVSQVLQFFRLKPKKLLLFKEVFRKLKFPKNNTKKESKSQFAKDRTPSRFLSLLLGRPALILTITKEQLTKIKEQS